MAGLSESEIALYEHYVSSFSNREDFSIKDQLASEIKLLERRLGMDMFNHKIEQYQGRLKILLTVEKVRKALQGGN